MINTALRWSGLALAAGALLLGVALLLPLINIPLSTPFSHLLSLIGSILIMLGLPGMYARQAERAGWLGLVGHVLLAVGDVLIIVASAQGLLTSGTDLQWDLAAATVFLSALFFGLIVTAIATLRAAVYSRWSAILMLVAAGALVLIVVASDYVPLAGPLGTVVYGIAVTAAFAWIGISIGMGLGQPRTGDAARPTTVSSGQPA